MAKNDALTILGKQLIKRMDELKVKLSRAEGMDALIHAAVLMAVGEIVLAISKSLKQIQP